MIGLLACFSSWTACASNISSEPVKSDDGNVTQWISVTGDIVFSDIARFQSVSDETQGTAIVYFNSPGGDLEAGIKIGRLIHKRGWNTAVDDTCASACALAWLAGRVKLAGEKSRIGFHVAYVGTDLKAESGLGNALVGLYLGELGMGENVVRYVASAPPDDMQWLSFRDARLLGIDVVPITQQNPPEANTHTPPPTSALRTSPQPLPPSPGGAGGDVANVDRAIKNALSRYRVSGMQGLQESSAACWKVVQAKRTLDKVQYCRVLDLIGVNLNDAGMRRFGLNAGMHHFSNERRISDLADGLLYSGISDVELAKKITALWQYQFDQEFPKFAAQ